MPVDVLMDSKETVSTVFRMLQQPIAIWNHESVMLMLNVLCTMTLVLTSVFANQDILEMDTSHAMLWIRQDVLTVLFMHTVLRIQ